MHWALLAVIAVVIAAWLAVGSGAQVSSQRIPLIDDTPNLAMEAGTPQSVRERNERLVAEGLLQLRKVGKEEPSREAGCRPNDYPGSLGPPAPRVTALIFGYHVEAVVRFDKLPTSPVCRPWAVRVTVIGKPIRAGGHFPWSQYYQLVGPVGRTVIRLPLYSTAPYELHVQSGTIQNRVSKRVRIVLRCPAAGCLAGEAPSLHEKSKNVQRFPLRAVSPAQLRESFRDGVEAIARSAPYMRHSTRCSGTAACQVTFTDPLFPGQPYRVRYTIGGEQRAGCWLVRDSNELDEPPYEDAYARAPQAGCVSWLK